MGVFSSDLFVLDMHLRPLPLILAFVGGVLVARASELPSLRQVARLDLGKAVRERGA